MPRTADWRTFGFRLCGLPAPLIAEYVLVCNHELQVCSTVQEVFTSFNLGDQAIDPKLEFCYLFKVRPF
jgi:hypothetical protein